MRISSFVIWKWIVRNQEIVKKIFSIRVTVNTCPSLSRSKKSNASWKILCCLFVKFFLLMAWNFRDFKFKSILSFQNMCGKYSLNFFYLSHVCNETLDNIYSFSLWSKHIIYQVSTVWHIGKLDNVSWICYAESILLFCLFFEAKSSWSFQELLIDQNKEWEAEKPSQLPNLLSLQDVALIKTPNHTGSGSKHPVRWWHVPLWLHFLWWYICQSVSFHVFPSDCKCHV